MSGPVWLIATWAVVGLITGAVLSPFTRRLLKPTRPRALLSAASMAPATALLFGLFACRIGLQLELLADSLMAAIGVPLAAADITTQRLPNALILPAYPAVLALQGTAAATDHAGCALLRSVVGMVILFALHGLLYYLLPGAIGGGDLKLAGILGLILGWVSWEALLNGTILGWVVAAIVHLILSLMHRTSRDAPIPLGAYLIIGTMVVVTLSPAT
jgi:leader peptidase (prepilin peptidase)/N-methyltransferase